MSFDEQPDGDIHGECAAEINELRAKLNAMEWQSMETAPKDGTNVLLINRRGNMATGLWQGSEHSEGWWIRGGSLPSVFFNDHHGPTHWMPLPKAPA